MKTITTIFAVAFISAVSTQASARDISDQAQGGSRAIPSVTLKYQRTIGQSSIFDRWGNLSRMGGGGGSRPATKFHHNYRGTVTLVR
jgi:hypothetical protein